MPKTKISEFSATPGNNTDIDGINIAEGCAPSGINDAIRELMAQLKDFQAGTAGDSFNGPVGTSTAAAGAFTTLSSTGNTTLGDASGDAVTINGATTFVNVSPTITPGTANGVAYLNGSKVLTTGSALTFDGTTVATTGKFGISGNGAVPSASAIEIGTNGAGSRMLFNVPTGGEHNFNVNGSLASWVSAASSGWYISGSEQMRLTSTGLGIGTSSPVANFKLTASLSYDGSGGLYVENTSTGTSASSITRYKNSGTTFAYTGIGGASRASYAGLGANVLAMYTDNTAGIALTVDAAGPITFNTNATTRATLDSSGNLGLGVTPRSGWNSGFKAMEFSGGYGAISGQTSGAGVFALSWGAYATGAGTWAYSTTGDTVGLYTMNSGLFKWYTAPSGTAGNAISFTQAMTLDASGNLGVGTTSPRNVSGYKNIAIDGSTSGLLEINTNGTRVFSLYGAGNDINLVNPTATGTMQFYTNNTERARITSGGKLLLNTTSTVVSGDEIFGAIGTSGLGVKCTGGSGFFAAGLWNNATSGDNVFVRFYTDTAGTERGSIDYNRAGGLTRYNTTSDYRAKDIIGPVQNPGATIDALKVYEGVMKGATQSRPMLIAHEAQAHAPYAVSGIKDEMNEDGTPKFQQMDVSSLVPLLLAEIQSLRARVAALESNP